MSKIVKNIRNINREDCGGLNKYVKRQDFKNLHGFKPAPIFRNTSFILPNLILLNLTLLNLTLPNLISLGVPYPHVLSYGLY